MENPKHTPSVSGHLLYALDVIDLEQLNSCETEDELEDRMMREKGQLVVEATWRHCTTKDENGILQSEIRKLQIGQGPVVDAQLLLDPRRGENQGLYICMSPIVSEGEDQASIKPQEIIKILPEGYVFSAGPDKEDDAELSSEATDRRYDLFYEQFPYANGRAFSQDVLIKQVVSLYATPEDYALFATEYDSREAQRAALYDEVKN